MGVVGDRAAAVSSAALAAPTANTASSQPAFRSSKPGPGHLDRDLVDLRDGYEILRSTTSGANTPSGGDGHATTSFTDDTSPPPPTTTWWGNPKPCAAQLNSGVVTTPNVLCI